MAFVYDGTCHAVPMLHAACPALMQGACVRGGICCCQRQHTVILQHLPPRPTLQVILLFSEGDWEKQMSPIELEDENGKAKTLKMSETDFRAVIGLIAMEEQAADGAGPDAGTR